MRAIVCPKYGPPDVLQLKEVEKPVPKENELRIRIYATAVTASDCIVRGFDLPLWHPMGFMMGLVIGFRKPRNPILGMVFAGEVESVGVGVTRFKVGDQVYGTTIKNSVTMRFGTYAEYKCLPENSIIAIKPKNTTYEEAAALIYGWGLAIYFLRKGKIRSGQEALIYGASGAIGTTAVQLARHDGARVTGVCSTANIELVKSLGAQSVIDYTKEDLKGREGFYDLIFDAVGKKKSSKLKTQSKQALKETGIYISVDDGSPKYQVEDLYLLTELVEAGEIKAVIDCTYPLDQIVEAHRYVEMGHKKGNVVITVAKPG